MTRAELQRPLHIGWNLKRDQLDEAVPGLGAFIAPLRTATPYRIYMGRQHQSGLHQRVQYLVSVQRWGQGGPVLLLLRPSCPKVIHSHYWSTSLPLNNPVRILDARTGHLVSSWEP